MQHRANYCYRFISHVGGGAVSHDRITRFLSGKDFDSKRLWMEVRPFIRQYESEVACLILDGTLIGKPDMDEAD